MTRKVVLANNNNDQPRLTGPGLTIELPKTPIPRLTVPGLTSEWPKSPTPRLTVQL